MTWDLLMTTSNSKFAIAWAGSSHRCWPSSCSTTWIGQPERRGHHFVCYA